MNAEERTLAAIKATRELMRWALRDPTAMAVMTHLVMNPEDVENQVAAILEYLDRTGEEEKPHG